MSDWPTADTVLLTLLAEAKKDALQLGHASMGFAEEAPGLWSACCSLCHEFGYVRPRSLREAKKSGVLLMMECKPDLAAASARRLMDALEVSGARLAGGFASLGAAIGTAITQATKP